MRSPMADHLSFQRAFTLTSFSGQTALSPIHEIRDESLVHALHTVKNMYFRTYVDIVPLHVFDDLHEFFFLGE